MAAAAKHGRTVKGKRGIGSGKASEKVSTSKTATSGIPKSKGDGKGAKGGKSGGKY